MRPLTLDQIAATLKPSVQPFWYTALRMNHCMQHADCMAMTHPISPNGIGIVDKYPTRQMADRAAWEIKRQVGTNEIIVLIRVPSAGEVS